MTDLEFRFRPRDIMVYVLIGFDGEGKPAKPVGPDDIYRQKRLREFGAVPYPMPYDRKKKDLVGFARWCQVDAWDTRVSWEEWEAAGYRPEPFKRRALANETPLFDGAKS